MKRTALVEGIIFLVFSFAGIVEGLRLTIKRDPTTVATDMLGPGYYIVFLGLALMVVGVVHLAVNYRKTADLQRVTIDKTMRTRLLASVAAIVMYIILITYVGYTVASIAFFGLEFRILGIKSWTLNAILTVSLTALYYIIFLYFCEMIFPRGVLF
jgi:hypothetical protein